ncbi:MAG: hypothetical protein ABEI58_00760 [Candidatus Nanohaloarchaea archaeon]
MKLDATTSSFNTFSKPLTLTLILLVSLIVFSTSGVAQTVGHDFGSYDSPSTIDQQTFTSTNIDVRMTYDTSRDEFRFTATGISDYSSNQGVVFGFDTNDDGKYDFQVDSVSSGYQPDYYEYGSSDGWFTDTYDFNSEGNGGNGTSEYEGVFFTDSGTLLQNKNSFTLTVNASRLGRNFAFNADEDSSAFVKDGSDSRDASDAVTVSTSTSEADLVVDGDSDTFNEDYEKINNALGNAQSGDTIVVKDGDYTSEGWTPVEKSVDLISKNQGGAKISRFCVRATDVTIKGFEIVSDGADYNGVSVEPTNGAVSGVVIRDNHIHNIVDAGQEDSKEASGILAWSSGSTELQNLTVRNNLIEDIGSDSNDAQGFGLFIEDLASNSSHTGLVVEGNTIRNIHSATINSNNYPGVGVSVLPELTNPGAGTSQSGIVTDNANAKIQNNEFSSNPVDISLAGDVSQFSSSSNQFGNGIDVLTEGNVPDNGDIGITELDGNTESIISNGPADVTENYWGSDGITIQRKGDVDYTPWYATSDFSKDVEVVNSSDETRAYSGTIQGGVDAADRGDTVKVYSGTYDESVTVDTHNVTLKGVSNPVVSGNGVNTGSRPHATFHVKDTTKNVVITGFTIKNPKGAYGIYAGSGGSGSNVTGLTVKENIIEQIGVDLVDSDTGGGSNPPLAGAVAGFYVRADYTGIEVMNNVVQNVEAPGSPGRAAGLSFSSFVGTAFDGKSAQNTKVTGNTVKDIKTPGRAKGISASGEFAGMTIKDNNLSNVGNSSTSDALAITLTENVGDFDSDSETERTGPRNFTIKNNEIKEVVANESTSLFVGGYEELGSAHKVRQNSFLSGAVARYAGKQSGYTPGDGDTVDAEHNYYGAASGPSGEAGGKGVSLSSVDSGREKIDYHPWLLKEDGERYDQTAAVTQADTWTVISAPQQLSENPTLVTDGGAPEATVTTFEGEGRWMTSADSQVQNPLVAHYVKVNDTAGVGFKFASSSARTSFVNETLEEGWNLVSTRANGKAKDQFAGIRASGTSDGMTTIWTPSENERKDVADSVAWSDSNQNRNIAASLTKSLPGEDVSRFDGYWVETNGDTVFSQIVG